MSDLVAKELRAFIDGYTSRLFLNRDDPRGAKRVQALLHLHRPDEISFDDDYLGTFAEVVPNHYLVPDTWTAFDRLAPILDARFEDYEATSFEGETPIALYERAAKRRDEHTIEARDEQAEKLSVPEDLLGALLDVVGAPLTDKGVKATLARAKLPVGKKIDEQANPALGVSYMGSKIAGKLSVTRVGFHEDGHEAHVRGLGSSVTFARWPGPLPEGLPPFPLTRDAIVAALGAPPRDDGDFLEWKLDARRLMVDVEDGKVVRLLWAMPRES